MKASIPLKETSQLQQMALTDPSQTRESVNFSSVIEGT